ncbi:MAG: uL15 family ribosomal protein, partial [Planctomycetota bacterium]
MNLNDVHRGIQKNRKRKRIGRGPGSGTGKTSGRGHKGHKSRSGYSRQPNFQGGAMPMFRR